MKFVLFVTAALALGACATEPNYYGSARGPSAATADPTHSVDGCHKQHFPQCGDHGGQ